jgi:hypothetical protein
MSKVEGLAMLNQDVFYVIQSHNHYGTLGSTLHDFPFCIRCTYQIDACLRVDKTHLELFKPRGYAVRIVQTREINCRGQGETRVSKANLLAN